MNPATRRRRVLITGAARGIGRAVSECYARAGYDIVAPTRAEMDLSDLESVSAFAQSDAVRDVDVLINNAGENRPQALGSIPLEELRSHLDVNLTSAFMLTRYVGAAMAQRGWGRIVNMSSVYGLVSRSGRSMYSTTKAGLGGLTRAAAVELGPNNVLVNAVCPGFVDTDLTRQNNDETQIAALCATIPLGRLAQVSEIADFMFYLGSEANSYITGQTIAIDGGFLCQ